MNANVITRPVQAITPSAKTTFGQRVRDGIEEKCEDMATRVDLSPDAIRQIAYKNVLKHPICKTIVKEKCEGARRESDDGVVIDSLRKVWKLISKPNIVATTEGWGLRRNILGSIAGPRLSYRAAARVLGGNLKKGTFNRAKRRREESFSENNVHLM